MNPDSTTFSGDTFLDRSTIVDNSRETSQAPSNTKSLSSVDNTEVRIEKRRTKRRKRKKNQREVERQRRKTAEIQMFAYVALGFVVSIGSLTGDVMLIAGAVRVEVSALCPQTIIFFVVFAIDKGKANRSLTAVKNRNQLLHLVLDSGQWSGCNPGFSRVAI